MNVYTGDVYTDNLYYLHRWVAAGHIGNWITAKRRLVEGRYAFNLCFENTRFRYYCTEKTWDAIRMKCLPIYLGSPTIYETFPQHSFLDFGEIRSADALFQQVRSISPAEYRQRYNRCVETLVRSVPLAESSYRRTMQNILEAFCIGAHARSF